MEKGGNFRREHKKKVEAGGGDTVVFEWYRVESCLVPVPLNSASIRRPSLFITTKMYSGASDRVLQQFLLVLKKRWPPNRTAEPEVQAIHPLRHLPSARKSRWHPSLRLFHAEPSCPPPDGSTKCPTISGFIKSCTHFWI